jgi:hypothetical protein
MFLLPCSQRFLYALIDVCRAFASKAPQICFAGAPNALTPAWKTFKSLLHSALDGPNATTLLPATECPGHSVNYIVPPIRPIVSPKIDSPPSMPCTQPVHSVEGIQIRDENCQPFPFHLICVCSSSKRMSGAKPVRKVHAPIRSIAALDSRRARLTRIPPPVRQVLSNTNVEHKCFGKRIVR